MGLISVPARAQLATYTDERGTVVYTNPNEPVRRAAPKATQTKDPKPQASPSPLAAAPAQPAPADAPASGSANVVKTAPFVSAPPAALDRVVQQTAERNHVDPQLVRAVISTESNWNPGAVSSKGAMGLMQLAPETAHRLGVGNAFDPAQNIGAGVAYLGMMLERYKGDVNKALAAYNAGPGAVDRFGGIPNFRETRNYVAKVTSSYFRPGANRESGAYERPSPIYRTTDSGGRVIFVNE